MPPDSSENVAHEHVPYPSRATQDVAERIAAALGEQEPGAIAQIMRVTRVLGEKRALEHLTKTQEVENQGGMLTLDGSRRRTAGGVFLRLIKEAVTAKERGRIFGPWAPKKGSRQGAKQGHNGGHTQQPAVPLTDEMVEAALSQLQFGEARQVKITLTGQPAKVVEKGDAIIVGLRSTRTPSLPKGLPVPAASTKYAIFIAKKQWAAVARALKSDPQDVLVIEGHPFLHPRFSQGIAVCATMLTTAALRAARRQAQREAAGQE
jgi:predicted Zn-ribbon and HTH transcriptional regulator